MATDNLASLFEDAVFDTLGPRVASRATGITPAGTLNDLAQGHTALRFTTAKAKVPGLKIQTTAKGYCLSGGDSRQGLIRVALDIANYLRADNGGVKLQFSDELQNFEPDEELVHKSSVPLWVIRPVRSGAVMIERTWESGK